MERKKNGAQYLLHVLQHFWRNFIPHLLLFFFFRVAHRFGYLCISNYQLHRQLAAMHCTKFVLIVDCTISSMLTSRASNCKMNCVNESRCVSLSFRVRTSRFHHEYYSHEWSYHRSILFDFLLHSTTQFVAFHDLAMDHIPSLHFTVPTQIVDRIFCVHCCRPGLSVINLSGSETESQTQFG